MTEDELIEAAGVRLVERLAALAGTPRPPATDPLDASRAATVTPRGSADPDAAMPTVAAMRRALDGGQTTPRALLDQCLARIARLDGTISAFLRVLETEAAVAADRAGEELAGGRSRGRLHGIPFAIKDAFDTAGILTTVGSRLFAERVPARDAALVERLRAAGAVMVGKLDTTELCLGGPSRDGGFGPAVNPWRAGCYAGASTSGGGAAVAAGLVPLAFGSDTGGSIRLPAALTGVTGVKPSHGLLPTEGLYPLSPTLDTAGPIALTVEDCALALDALAGVRPGAPAAVVGVPTGHGTDCPGISPEAAGALLAAVDLLRGAGIAVRPVDLPGAEAFTTAFAAIMMPDGYALHAARLAAEGEAARMSWHTRARLSLGAFVPQEARAAVAPYRAALRAAWERATEDAPVLLTVGTLGEAPLMEDVAPFAFLDAPLVHCPANVAGGPSLTMPVAISSSAMPLAVQLSARQGGEGVLIATAARLEAALGGPPPRPPGFGPPG